MSTSDEALCERWAELSDRKMLDESLAEDDARFYEEHAKSCPVCSAEAGAWASLADLPDEPSLPDDQAEALVERVLAATEAKKLPLREEREPEAKKLPLREAEPAEAKKLPLREEPGVVSLDERRTRNRLLAGTAAVLAVAAGVVLYLRAGAGPAAGPGATLVGASGDVRVTGEPVKVGAAIPMGARINVGPGGHACLAFDEGRVKTCLGASSELALAKTDAADRELLLTEGTVVTALEKLAPGHHFTVSSPKGRATVTGTVFSVTTPRGEGSLVVRVHEGSVEVGAGRTVEAGQELDVTRGVERLVDPNVRDQELSLVGVTLPRHAAFAPLPSASVASAEPAPSPAPSASEAPETQPKPPSAAEMLSAARALRAQGNSAGAAEGYRRLMAVHPKSAEARAALLSLAELQLGPLGDPAGALRSYDAYLRSGGGGLAQEAQYGRIQALRRLGRAAEERTAIEAFVKAYPNSVQARALKSRLEGGSP